MNKLFIFGTSFLGEIAHFYFKDLFNIQGFIVDKEFYKDEKFLSLPVLTTDEFLKKFKPDKDLLTFVAIGYSSLNKKREEKYKFFKEKGYKFASYISKDAWVAGNVKIGEHNFILEHNVVQPFVVLGNNNFLWSGNHIGHHVKIGNSNFISSHVVVSGKCIIGDNNFIGVNTTIGDSIKIGSFNFINAGSLILSDISDFEVYSPKPTEKRKIKSDRLRI